MGSARDVIRRLRPLGGSAAYWERRYRGGGTSGAGSYGENAEAKAAIVNQTVAAHAVTSVIEFGCGDGNQLTLLDVPRYVGLDVAPAAIDMCARRFENDPTKSFFRYDPEHFADRAGVLRCDLALSQEVIFHLVEDEVYERYMSQLFAAASRLVLVCSSDRDEAVTKHLRHRRFTAWVTANHPDWSLAEHTPSPRPVDPLTGQGLDADFFLFVRG
jgi:cyclopropane fatty-acyl-phospholipid synthase-like methyltransferase